MPNTPMPPPYPICASHAARLAGLESNKSNRRSYEAPSGPAGGLVQVQTEGAMPAAGESPARPRTHSAQPVNHVFAGRRPDLAKRLRDREQALNEHIMALEDQVQRLQRQVVSMACAATDDSDTHRQRIADLWSRIDALEQRAREQAADLAETREALKAAQRRLREMDEDSHGERG